MSGYLRSFHILASGMLSVALFIVFWLTAGFDGYHMYHLGLYIVCGVYWMLTIATIMMCIRGSGKKLFYFLCFLHAIVNLAISCGMVLLLTEKAFCSDIYFPDLIYFLFFGSILIISAMTVYTIIRMVLRFLKSSIK